MKQVWWSVLHGNVGCRKRVFVTLKVSHFVRSRSSVTFSSLLLNKEYVLAHTEMPTTLEGAEAAIKKQEDFMTTMDANEEKINAVVETGRRLVSDGNINSDRIQEKVDSIDDRYSVLRFLGESCTLGLEHLCHWPEVQWTGCGHLAELNLPITENQCAANGCLKSWFSL